MSTIPNLSVESLTDGTLLSWAVIPQSGDGGLLTTLLTWDIDYVWDVDYLDRM